VQLSVQNKLKKEKIKPQNEHDNDNMTSTLIQKLIRFTMFD